MSQPNRILKNKTNYQIKIENKFIKTKGGIHNFFLGITLLWTLLRQSPIAGKPTIEKAIIVCPSSLVRNWSNELVKWLGAGRICPLACESKGTKAEITNELQQFVARKGRAIINPGITEIFFKKEKKS